MAHQNFLARTVAVVHAMQLRHRLVAFVDVNHGVAGQVIEQGRGSFARQPPREVPRVVLDAVAIADLLNHLEIEHRALIQALGLNHLPCFSSSLCHHSSSLRMLSRADSLVSSDIT